MKRHNRRKWYFVTGSVFILASFLLPVYWLLPSVVAEVRNPLAAWFNPVIKDTVAPAFQRYGIKDYSLFRIPVNDSIRLAGYVCRPGRKARGTVIALHGYRSNKNRFLPVVKYFTDAGWNFVAADLRAHNQSTGETTGFSYYERYDVSALIDTLTKQHFPRPYVLYGHSIGAATAVFVAARRQDIDALILESAFDDFSRLIPNYLHFYVSENMEIPQDVSRSFFERLHIPLDSLKPIEVAPEIHIPVIQIQGTDDRKVKPKQARRLFEAFGTNRKEWILIEGGNHNKLWLPGEPAYFHELVARLDSLLF